MKASEQIHKAHNFLDDFNGQHGGIRTGELCFCGADRYNEIVGIVHRENCPILRLRKAIPAIEAAERCAKTVQNFLDEWDFLVEEYSEEKDEKLHPSGLGLKTAVNELRTEIDFTTTMDAMRQAYKEASDE